MSSNIDNDIVNCLHNLVQKLETIEHDSNFHNVMQVAAANGQPYQGPDWFVELNNARDLLKILRPISLKKPFWRTTDNGD